MSKANRNSAEFENFDRTMRELIKVPHSTIKAKLDAEKTAKAKRRKARKPSADRDSDASTRDSGD